MTKKDFLINILKSFAVIMVIVLAITFTFLHEYQPAKSSEYIAVKSNYKKIIKERDLGYSEIIQDLENGIIGSQIYIEKYKAIKLNSELELSDYHSCKEEVIAKDAVLGYTSYKNYLLGIAFPFFGLFTTLLLLFVIVKSVKDKWSKLFYLFLCFSLIATWGYWVGWSNLNHTQDPNRPGDFPRVYYNICLYVLPIIAFFLFYFLFNFYKTIEEKVSSIVHLFYSALFKQIPEKNLINPHKEKEYKLFRLELTKKAVENE